MISASENSNEIPKNQVLEGKSVDDVVTLGPMAHATLVNVNTTQMKGKTSV